MEEEDKGAPKATRGELFDDEYKNDDSEEEEKQIPISEPSSGPAFMTMGTVMEIKTDAPKIPKVNKQNAFESQSTVWEGGKGQAIAKDEDDVFGSDSSSDGDPIRVDAAQDVNDFINQYEIIQPQGSHTNEKIEKQPFELAVTEQNANTGAEKMLVKDTKESHQKFVQMQAMKVGEKAQVNQKRHSVYRKINPF